MTILRQIVLYIIGIGCLVMSFTIKPVTEDKLTVFEGIPTKFRELPSKRYQTTYFVIGDVEASYKSTEPHYSEIQSIAQSGKSVKVLLNFPNKDSSPGQLYKLNVGDRPVVTYAETLESVKNDNIWTFWMGLLVIALASWRYIFGFFRR